MSKIKVNKKIIKKMVTILCLMLCFNSILPVNVSFAGGDEATFGGKLLSPIMDLFLAFGDVIMNFLHGQIIGAGDAIIKIDMVDGKLKTFLTIAFGIFVTAATAAILFFTGLGIAAIVTKIVAAIASAVGAAATSALTAATVGTIVVASISAGAKVGVVAGAYANSNWFGDEVVLTKYLITPEEIFSGELEELSVNFFSNKSTSNERYSIAQQIKGSISKWYYIIRNIAIILMMPILIYIGIRILLTSVASEKSKYKNMLQDWLIAFCLIFIMQYIMVFAMNIVESITDLLNYASSNQERVIIIKDEDGKVEKYLKEKKEEDAETVELWNEDMKYEDEDGNSNILWPVMNLMGIIRTEAALVDSGTIQYIGYTMCFLVLVWYTLFFVYTYIKRIIYLAFLTVIAPLVAMTYPIDKINDGKAQAFDMWLKEYIFNLLIQPVHLLMYTLLVSMAFEFAETNIIYSLVAIGFVMPAEKLLRRFFGFEKAQTPGMLGGAAGAALMMDGLNHVLKRRHAPKEKNGNPGGGKVDNNNDDGNTYLDTTGINDNLLMDGSGSGASDPNTYWSDNDYSEMAQDLRNPNVSSEDKDFWRDQLLGNATGNYRSDIIDELMDPNVSEADKDFWQSELLNDLGQSPTTTVPSRPIQSNNTANRSMIRGVKKATQNYIGQKLNNFSRSFSPGNGIRKLGNMATGAFVGVGTGLLGATLGIASGDMSKVVQYGSTTAAGGYALASRSKKSNVDMKKVQEEYQKGYYGNMEAYKKARVEETREKFMDNEKKMNDLQEKMNYSSMKEAKNKMKEYEKFIDAGFTDTKDIASMIKMVEEQGWSQEKAMTVAKFNNKLPTRPSKMGKKESEDFDFKCRKIAEANNVADVDKAVKEIKRNVELYGKTKDKLNNV